MEHRRTAACLAWVAGRLMPDGGYCAFRDEGFRAGFSNIADTAWALEIFRRLREIPPELPRTAAWIESLQRNSLAWSRSPALAWTLMARSQAALPFREEERGMFLEEVERLAEDGEREEGERVDEDLAALLRLPGAPDLPGSLASRLSDLVGALELRKERECRPLTLPALADRMTILAKGGVSPEDILRMSQEEESFRHPVWGWIRTRGSNSFEIFVVRSGARLAARRRAPVDTEAIESLVLSCQSRGGGFGPLPGAIPGLDATLCAVEILQSIRPTLREPSPRQGGRAPRGNVTNKMTPKGSEGGGKRRAPFPRPMNHGADRP